MRIFEAIRDYEELVFINEESSGLRAIICIHNTTLGPALGGCRLYNYNSEEDAIVDVLRLARGMTYKSAAAGINWGGGKCVVWGDPRTINRELVFTALGRHIEGLHGRYVTAEDMNTTPRDMLYIKNSTDYVCGLARSNVDPSWYTATGTYHAIRASVRERYNTDSLQGIRVALQGLGSVSSFLAEMLHRDGAILIVTDVNEERTRLAQERYNATIVGLDEIISADCDVLSPSAIGGIINERSIPTIRAQVITGCANNQLLRDEDADSLSQLGILYAPDYIVNAGGVISTSREFYNNTEEEVMAQISNIYNTCRDIFRIAREQNISTASAANHFAENRINAMSRLDRIYTPRPKGVLYRL